jgi:hypothetical protein
MTFASRSATISADDTQHPPWLASPKSDAGNVIYALRPVRLIAWSIPTMSGRRVSGAGQTSRAMGAKILPESRRGERVSRLDSHGALGYVSSTCHQGQEAVQIVQNRLEGRRYLRQYSETKGVVRLW